ncbi:unnamed protein product, partial [Urochloa humidicola]
ISNTIPADREGKPLASCLLRSPRHRSRRVSSARIASPVPRGAAAAATSSIQGSSWAVTAMAVTATAVTAAPSTASNQTAAVPTVAASSAASIRGKSVATSRNKDSAASGEKVARVGHKRKQDGLVVEMMGRFLEKKEQQAEAENAFSLPACISIVDEMEDLSDDEKIEAYDVFKDEQNRFIFMTANESRRNVRRSKGKARDGMLKALAVSAKVKQGSFVALCFLCQELDSSCYCSAITSWCQLCAEPRC